MAGIVAILAAYAAFARSPRRRLRRSAVVVAGVGCLACIVGLLRLGHDGLDVAFGLAAGAFVHGVLALVVLLL